MHFWEYSRKRKYPDSISYKLSLQQLEHFWQNPPKRNYRDSISSKPPFTTMRPTIASPKSDWYPRKMPLLFRALYSFHCGTFWCVRSGRTIMRTNTATTLFSQLASVYFPLLVLNRITMRTARDGSEKVSFSSSRLFFQFCIVHGDLNIRLVLISSRLCVQRVFKDTKNGDKTNIVFYSFD